ncbi:uncharacterized protein HMPREF1541_07449 [Cyphellophora europaea CBS 101466]|uniref:NAD(P)-binding protein n=1 Tax=Cyphellophora europaea (strain CBS 101466) TaxID=1220924 RepID=W2RMU5_CYPE1|nr:uncharacterized protein HMPREF1541_07449 [Cyphellophora europaea CBS 101466]ETN37826.1 hypothetical protein HMPREF1541_07449 [Cyphellophora europaea CBS 101466]
MSTEPFGRANIGDLSDRIALITGASSGIGRMVAQAYAGAGAYIMCADITPNPPKTPMLEDTTRDRGTDLSTPTVDLLNQKWPGGDKPRASYVDCDVTKAESVEAAVKATASQYGRLDIMVNNAGVAIESHSAPMPLHELPVSAFDTSYSVNIRGVWLGIKYAVTQMLAQPPHPSGDRGWIINMSSIYGLVASKYLSAYCTAKGAVTNLTRQAALEYAESKIHVNSIHPGYCDSPFLERSRQRHGGQIDEKWTAAHPWGRLAWPEDVAKMAVFLAGDGVAFVTGQRMFKKTTLIPGMREWE